MSSTSNFFSSMSFEMWLSWDDKYINFKICCFLENCPHIHKIGLSILNNFFFQKYNEKKKELHIKFEIL